MIERELEAKLRALEEFVSDHFSHYPDSKWDSGIKYRFIEGTDVSENIDPEYLDYFKSLTKRD